MRCRNNDGLGYCAFARHYLRYHFCFLFLRLLRCFSSPGRPRTLCGDAIAGAGLPHSDIHGSMGMCPSPWLFAACHVLLRSREPRHPSCALLAFPFVFIPPCVCFMTQGGRSLSFLLLVSQLLLRYLAIPALPSCQCPLFCFVENNGFEPLTPCLQSRCSSQLS